jgi:hypothetical protein
MPVKDTPEVRQKLREYTRQQVEKYNAEKGTKLSPQLVEALFEHESQGFNPYAKSHTGASGIPQFTIGTAKEYGLSPADRFNPVKAIPAGIAHFAKGLEAYPDSLVNGIRAYNGGVEGTRRYLAGERLTPKEAGDEAEAARRKEVGNFPSHVIKAAKRIKGSLVEKAPVEAAPAVVTTETPTIAPLPVAADMGGGRDVEGTPTIGTVGSIGSNLGYAVGKGALDTMTQFPRELMMQPSAETIMAQQYGPLMMGQPPPPLELPPIDPMGALNFVTAPLGGGRIVSGGVSAGLATLNTADAIARAKATAEGKDWDTLGAGDRASRVAAETINDENATQLGLSAVSGFALGALTGKSRKADANRLAAGRYTKLESEAILKIKRQKRFMSPEERVIANQEMRGALEREFFVPKQNPGQPLLQELQLKYGMREVPDEVEDIDGRLSMLREQAERRGLLKGDPERVAAIQALTAPIDPAFDLKVKATDLENRAHGTQNMPVRMQLLAEAQTVRQQIDQMPKPTLADVTGRMANFDALRRKRAFRMSVEGTDANFLGLLKDASHDFRGERGLVSQMLQPHEDALWRQGNELTHKWWNDKRALGEIAQAFGDGMGGGKKIRNKLMGAKRDQYIERLGPDNYKQLLKLARAADTLTSHQRGGELVEMLTKSFVNLRTPVALGAAAAAAGAGFGGSGQAIAGAGFGTFAGFLLTNRVAARSFEKMARLVDKASSNEFARAYSRFMTAAMIHQSYGEPIAPDDDAQDKSPPPTHRLPPAPAQMATTTKRLGIIPGE